VGYSLGSRIVDAFLVGHYAQASIQVVEVFNYGDTYFRPVDREHTWPGSDPDDWGILGRGYGGNSALWSGRGGLYASVCGYHNNAFEKLVTPSPFRSTSFQEVDVAMERKHHGPQHYIDLYINGARSLVGLRARARLGGSSTVTH
jgi:hypothetical protein